jgi:antitoxin HigA-1
MRAMSRSSITTEVRCAMLPKNRPPTAPGEMLLEEFLKPRGVTQVELASRMGVPIQRVNTIVNGKRGITAETAILLAEALDTTPEFWMGLQADYDLWHALRKRETATVKGKARGAVARARGATSDAPGRHRSA